MGPVDMDAALIHKDSASTHAYQPPGVVLCGNPVISRPPDHRHAYRQNLPTAFVMPKPTRIGSVEAYKVDLRSVWAGRPQRTAARACDHDVCNALVSRM